MTLLEQPMPAWFGPYPFSIRATDAGGFGPYPFSIRATDTDDANTWHVEAQRAEDGGHVFQTRILLHAQT